MWWSAWMAGRRLGRLRRVMVFGWWEPVASAQATFTTSGRVSRRRRRRRRRPPPAASSRPETAACRSPSPSLSSGSWLSAPLWFLAAVAILSLASLSPCQTFVAERPLLSCKAGMLRRATFDAPPRPRPLARRLLRIGTTSSVAAGAVGATESAAAGGDSCAAAGPSRQRRPPRPTCPGGHPMNVAVALHVGSHRKLASVVSARQLEKIRSQSGAFASLIPRAAPLLLDARLRRRLSIAWSIRRSAPANRKARCG